MEPVGGSATAAKTKPDFPDILTAMRWRWLAWLLAVLFFCVAGMRQLNAQSGNPNDPVQLAKIEDRVIQKLSAIQKAKWHRADHFVSSKTARRIACSLAANDATYSDSLILNTCRRCGFQSCRFSPSTRFSEDARRKLVCCYEKSTRRSLLGRCAARANEESSVVRVKRIHGLPVA